MTEQQTPASVVERLRAAEPVYTKGPDYYPIMVEPGPLRLEAAALIERLSAEREGHIKALEGLLALPVAKAELDYLDRGIGTKTQNAAWLRARAALTQGESSTERRSARLRRTGQAFQGLQAGETVNHSDHLMALCGVIAGFIPSEAAVDHACLEWQLAREVWLAALESLGLPENEVRAGGAVAVANAVKALRSS